VAIDAAACDLVNKQPGFKESFLTHHHEPGDDKFAGMRPNTDGPRQLRYAEELGLGTRDYELIQIIIPFFPAAYSTNRSCQT